MGNSTPEKRCCDECGHTGTDGGSTTESYCGGCGETVPYPEEDHCPACGKTNCMLIACPECGGRYSLADDECGADGGQCGIGGYCDDCHQPKTPNAELRGRPLADGPA